MVEKALRGVVREALARTASSGLPGAHHFYITFHTGFPGVRIPDYLAKQYPGEMTIVLEHQFWNLEVCEDCFSVTLSFQNRPEKLAIPFEAITAFADPAVKFGLQFTAEPAAASERICEPAATPLNVADKAKPADIVTLDAFRKK
jgi:uncharacterized protein